MTADIFKQKNRNRPENEVQYDIGEPPIIQPEERAMKTVAVKNEKC